MTGIKHLDSYIQLLNHKGIKSSKVTTLIAKTVSELSPAEQIGILESNNAEDLEKIFVSAYENNLFEVCATIKRIMNK